VAPSCSGKITPPEDVIETRGNEPVGRLGLALELEPGVELREVTYIIAHPNGYTRMGSIPLVDGVGTASAYFVLPAQRNYVMHLAAPAANVTCSGYSHFDVPQGAETSVDVQMHCPGARRLGSVEFRGRFNICPAVDSIVASYEAAIVGDSIALHGEGSDPDEQPSPLAYTWSASDGELSDAEEPDASLQCTAPGVVAVSLTVSDGDTNCAPAVTSFYVSCVPDPHAAAGAGAGSGGEGEGDAGIAMDPGLPKDDDAGM
jgi:hypothetical protein